MKKTLLALATASTVALAGTSVAVAAEDAGNPTGTPAATPADTKEGEKSPLAGSTDAKGSNELFGWHDTEWKDADGKTQQPTTLLKKITDIGALFGVIVTIVGGIATLAANVQKIADSFKK